MNVVIIDRVYETNNYYLKPAKGTIFSIYGAGMTGFSLPAGTCTDDFCGTVQSVETII